MYERPWLAFRNSAKRPSRASDPPRQSLVLSLHPPHQVGIHLSPQRFQRLRIESPVVVRPATEHWSEHVREIAQLLVAHELEMPPSHRPPHRRQRFAADARRKVHIDPAVLVHRLARPKRVAENRKLAGGLPAPPVNVPTVHDPRLLRVQLESTLP